MLGPFCATRWLAREPPPHEVNLKDRYNNKESCLDNGTNDYLDMTCVVGLGVQRQTVPVPLLLLLYRDNPFLYSLY